MNHEEKGCSPDKGTERTENVHGLGEDSKNKEGLVLRGEVP